MVSSVVTRTAVQADSAKTTFQLKTVSPGDGSGDSVTHALVDASSNVVNPGTHEDLVALLTKNESIRAVLAGILSIQGTVTANLGVLNGAASDAVLGQILGAIKAQIDVAPLFVTDGANTYVRRERVNEGTGVITVEFEGMDGTIVSLTPAQVAALSPITSKSRVATPVYYDVLVAGTGFGVQDTIAEVVITDTVTGALTVIWQNLSQGTTIAAPLNTSVRKQVNGVSLMSQSAGLALDTSVQQLVASIGSVSDLATASTLVGLLKAILTRTPGLGAALASASSPVALATDQLALLAKDASVTALATLIGTIASPAAGSILGLLTSIKSDLDTDVANNATAIAAIGTTGTWQTNLLNATGKTLSNAPRVSTTGTVQNVGDVVALAFDGMNSAGIQLAAGAANATGAGVFDATLDGTTWFATNMVPYAGGALAAGASIGTAAQPFEMACGLITGLRFRCTVAFSAATTVLIAAANGHKSLRVSAPAGNPLPTLPSAVVATSATGTLSAIGDTVALAVEGMSTVDIEAICASASWAGTTVIEMLPKGGSTWYATSVEPFEGGAALQALPPGVLAQLFTKHGGGLSQIRVRAVTAIASGPVTINISAYAGIKGARVSAPKANPAFVSQIPVGVGADFAMPTLANAYGTAIGAAPSGSKGIAIWVPPGASLVWTVQAAATAYTSASPMPAAVTKSYTNGFSVGQWIEESFDPTLSMLFLKSWTPGTDTASSPPVPRWQ